MEVKNNARLGRIDRRLVMAGARCSRLRTGMILGCLVIKAQGQTWTHVLNISGCSYSGYGTWFTPLLQNSTCTICNYTKRNVSFLMIEKISWWMCSPLSRPYKGEQTDGLQTFFTCVVWLSSLFSVLVCRLRGLSALGRLSLGVSTRNYVPYSDFYPLLHCLTTQHSATLVIWSW